MKTFNQGFSLIEILVSLFLASTVMLGLCLAQVKALQSVNDSFFRQAAVELSNNYLVRLRIESFADSALLSTQAYANWLEQVKSLLPVDDELIHSHYITCFSSNVSSCDGTTRALNIQIAWYSVSDECISQGIDGICFYRVRAAL